MRVRYYRIKTQATVFHCIQVKYILEYDVKSSNSNIYLYSTYLTVLQFIFNHSFSPYQIFLEHLFGYGLCRR